MLPRSHPDGIHIAFDERRLVANAGLILPAIMALHLGLPQLVDRRLDLGRAQALLFCCHSGQGIIDAHQVLITQIPGCEALVLQYGADCITSVGAELRQEPRR